MTKRQIKYITLYASPDLEIRIQTPNDIITMELTARIHAMLERNHDWNADSKVHWLDEDANLPEDRE